MSQSAEPPWGVERTNVACPACGVAPRVGQMWACQPDGCGALFDTFATRARCPGCDAQFPWTECLACGGRFAHVAWYRGTR
jgi:hypothetical protein